MLNGTVLLIVDRSVMQEKAKMREEIKRHVKLNAQYGNDHYKPLLIYPEGTCVNNKYTVMFHKGAFELDCWVCPIAIKYDKKRVDPYWATAKTSFFAELCYLCSRWYMPVDVYWLEPTAIQENETPIEFAGRVKGEISQVAGLKIAHWDGYLKIPSQLPSAAQKLRMNLQKLYCKHINNLFEGHSFSQSTILSWIKDGSLF